MSCLFFFPRVGHAEGSLGEGQGQVSTRLVSYGICWLHFGNCRGACCSAGRNLSCRQPSPTSKAMKLNFGTRGLTVFYLSVGACMLGLIWGEASNRQIGAQRGYMVFFWGDGELWVSLLCRLKAPRHPSQEDPKNMFLRPDGHEKGDLEALEASRGDVGQEEQTAAEQEAARAALCLASAF